ncbi:MAG: hypothetical protein IPM01_24825 [Burkholderiaceae bacterium]|nr:hypothetical protein [Burkholderiaceae bacterium]
MSTPTTVSPRRCSTQDLRPGTPQPPPDYDFPDFKTDNHVCVLGAEKAAWFKDTEGNVLCLHEDIPQGASAVT